MLTISFAQKKHILIKIAIHSLCPQVFHVSSKNRGTKLILIQVHLIDHNSIMSSRATQCKDDLTGLFLCIKITAIDQESSTNSCPNYRRLCMVNVWKREDHGLCLGIRNRNEDFLFWSGVLDMKYLHAICGWEWIFRCTRRKDRRRVKLKVGPMVIPTLPKETEICEEIVEGVLSGEAREMKSNYDQATIGI